MPEQQPGDLVPARPVDDVGGFRVGFRMAFEPPPDDGGAPDETTTTLVSWWNHLECQSCGHTFRRGDRVRYDGPTSTVTHLDPALGCAVPAGESRQRPAAESTPLAADLAEFADGMDATWPPAGNTPVSRLDASDWRTIRPRPPLGRDRCLYCGHTFRPDEHVIICPCSPADPVCGAAVHRDPAAGLICWESWQPTGHVRICPVTSSRVGLRGTPR